MFTVAERPGLRAALISAARADERITGVALTGSASTGPGLIGPGSTGPASTGPGLTGSEDRWSDIDLVFGFAGGTDLGEAIDGWTSVMYADHGAVHHLDVLSGATT